MSDLDIPMLKQKNFKFDIIFNYENNSNISKYVLFNPFLVYDKSKRKVGINLYSILSDIYGKAPESKNETLMNIINTMPYIFFIPNGKLHSFANDINDFPDIIIPHGIHNLITNMIVLNTENILMYIIDNHINSPLALGNLVKSFNTLSIGNIIASGNALKQVLIYLLAKKL